MLSGADDTGRYTRDPAQPWGSTYAPVRLAPRLNAIARLSTRLAALRRRHSRVGSPRSPRPVKQYTIITTSFGRLFATPLTPRRFNSHDQTRPDVLVDAGGRPVRRPV